MVSSRHILEQGPVLSALGQTALSALKQKLRPPTGGAPAMPGPVIELTVPPRPPELIRAYVGVVGGDRRMYRDRLPAHFFPQWTFGPAARTLGALPYPLAKVVNGGCRLVVRGPLPSGVPLKVSAQLVGIDDDGRRAIIHQVIKTGPAEQPDAVEAHMHPIVVYGRREEGGERKKRARPLVPQDVREVAFFKIGASAGLDYAKVTGDFNPIHWVPLYARASGFKNTILHGFATMARAMEGLNRSLFAHADPITDFDVRFVRPLVLPARVGLYVSDADGSGRRGVWVGSAPGGDAYMSGTFEAG